MATKYKRQKATSSGTPTVDERLPGVPWLQFLMAWHPKDWEFVDGAWLPRVRQIPLRPGVNGCKGAWNNDGTVKWANATLMRVSMEAQGWRFLPDDMAILRTDDDTGEVISESGYLDSIEGIRGTFYCTPWDRPRKVGYGRDAKADKGEWDHPGFQAWRLHLLEQGIIPPPPAEVLSQRIKVQETRAARKVGQAHDGAPHIQAQVEAEHERLSGMRSAAGLDETTGKKVPRKRRKKATVTEGADAQ